MIVRDTYAAKYFPGVKHILYKQYILLLEKHRELEFNFKLLDKIIRAIANKENALV